jgi:hypothetical protein
MPPFYHKTFDEGDDCNSNQFFSFGNRRIYIEEINWPFLSEHGGSPAEYRAGLELTIERGWLWLHESGTYVKLTPAGAELFA